MRHLVPHRARAPISTPSRLLLPRPQLRHVSYRHQTFRRVVLPNPNAKPADNKLDELTQRRLPLIYSDLTPGNSHALTASLASFLPAEWTAPWASYTTASSSADNAAASSSTDNAAANSSADEAAANAPADDAAANFSADTNTLDMSALPPMSPGVPLSAADDAAASSSADNAAANSSADNAAANSSADKSLRKTLTLPPTSPAVPLPPAHHLVYFNPAVPAEELLPDGTDPLQSPGEPFVRRMWAGGHVAFNPSAPQFELNGARAVCVEKVRTANFKGYVGAENVYVGIERRMGYVKEGESEEQLRERLWGETEDDWRDAVCRERRNLVFLRGRTKYEAYAEMVKAEAEKNSKKILRPLTPPTFSHTLTPTPSLLFRYSALTFNAHSIHLDPEYCRTVEGYRGMLVHGPLTLTLLMALLNGHIGPGKRVTWLGYRNLMPLYCNEPIKLCGIKAERESSDGVEKYEIWAETPEGGYAVKGAAKVVSV